MDYGLCLPNFRAGASLERMEAATEVVTALAERFARDVAPLV
jgi:hypothetical protein